MISQVSERKPTTFGGVQQVTRVLQAARSSKGEAGKQGTAVAVESDGLAEGDGADAARGETCRGHRSGFHGNAGSGRVAHTGSITADSLLPGVWLLPWLLCPWLPFPWLHHQFSFFCRFICLQFWSLRVQHFVYIILSVLSHVSFPLSWLTTLKMYFKKHLFWDFYKTYVVYDSIDLKI